MNERDFAIVVAIDKYEDRQNFQDLNGPTNDAADFIEWLKSPKGGGLPERNVDPYVRVSKPNGSSPTVSDIERVLRELFTSPRTGDGPIGRRLYVFLAGHGFTPTVNLALLHAFESRRRAPAYVSAIQWLDCFHSYALFDELVLCMDCCRDFEATYETPGRPCLSGYDGAANRVKRLYLLATGMGLKAYERPLDGKVRGLLSYALVSALKGDAVDGDGKMTAANVAESIRRALAPMAAAGLNHFPDPVYSSDFVLFNDRPPRSTPVRVRVVEPSYTVHVFRGDDTRYERPIAPTGVEDATLTFDLLRGKTYIAIVRDAAGQLMPPRSFEVKTEPVSFEIERAQ